MKLSEKYIQKINSNQAGTPLYSSEQLIVYGQIRALEANKTMLVQNQSFMNNDRYIEELSEATNALQEIAEKETL